MKRKSKTKQPTAREPETGVRRYSVAEVAEHSIAMRKLMERFPEARTVLDATQDKMLLVTDGDVAAGQPKNPAACAVAQCAIRQGLGGMIGREFAYLINGSEVTRYHLGKDAQVRTAIFDDRGTMKSGPVILNAPAPARRLTEMGKRVRAHRTFARIRAKKKKPASPKVRDNQKRDDAIRKSVISYGFRSWDRA